MYSTLTYVLFGLVIFLANLMQGITGFAGNVLAMPPSIYLVGVDDARIALNVVGLFSGSFLAILRFRNIQWRELARMMLFMIPGLIVGIAVYSYFPSHELLIVYGAVICVIGIANLLLRRRLNPPTPVMYLLVVLAGVMQGAFVSGGPLLVIYAMVRLPEKEGFRATLSAVWVIANAIIFVEDLAASAMTVSSWTLVGVALVPLLAAMFLGDRLAERLDQKVFMRITCVLIAVSGAILAVNA